MAVAERSLTALDSLGLNVDTMMAIVRTVDSYVHGATNAEITLHQLMEGRGWSSDDELKTGLAPQMIWLMGTGRYPTFQRYLLEGTPRTTRSGSSRPGWTTSSTASPPAWASDPLRTSGPGSTARRADAVGGGSAGWAASPRGRGAHRGSEAAAVRVGDHLLGFRPPASAPPLVTSSPVRQGLTWVGHTV
ncbi:hypothetical protein ACFQX6_58140 [Streptosporangium lutulentum]